MPEVTGRYATLTPDNMTLFAELYARDNSWHIVYLWWNKVIIANSSGQVIEAATFRAALEIALQEEESE